MTIFGVELTFFANSVILFAIIIALTGFKVFTCKPFKEDGEDFDLRKLLLGMSGNLGVLLILSLVYFVGAYFGADLAVIKIGTAEYTIQAMLNALIILAIGVYGVKLYKNAVDFFGLTETAKSKDELKVKAELSTVDYNVNSENTVEKG